MHDAQRYRRCAADCLRAAYRERTSNSRGLRLSMAASWISLADQDEAMDELLAQVGKGRARTMATLGHYRGVTRAGSDSRSVQADRDRLGASNEP